LNFGKPKVSVAVLDCFSKSFKNFLVFELRLTLFEKDFP